MKPKEKCLVLGYKLTQLRFQLAELFDLHLDLFNFFLQHNRLKVGIKLTVLGA